MSVVHFLPFLKMPCTTGSIPQAVGIGGSMENCHWYSAVDDTPNQILELLVPKFNRTATRRALTEDFVFKVRFFSVAYGSS